MNNTTTSVTSEETLYHYTSLQGFQGITTNSSLWMTKSTFLNDPDDCTLLTSLIEQYLSNKKDDIFKMSNITTQIDQTTIEQLFKKGCDPINYINFIRHSIPLYVISFTKSNDSIPMWKCYGKDGMQLAFNKETLLKSLQHHLQTDEYIITSDVIYAENVSLDTISLPTEFSEIVLADKDSCHIFHDHYNDRNKHDNLYRTNELHMFIDTYIKSYILTLNSLLSEIDTNNIIPDTIFKKIFKYTMKASGALQWKRDLTLYLIVLSALIKHDSYQNENEHRLVYFECNIEDKKIRKEKYAIRQMPSGSFLYPYINLQNSPDSTATNNQDDITFLDALQKVTLSPLVKTLPIDPDEYQENIKKFVSEYKDKIVVTQSQHNIRW